MEMRTRAFAAVLLAGTMPTGAAALADTIPVARGESIQAAIDRARPGDTVSVAPGQYAPFEVTRDGVRVVSSEPGGARVVAPAGRAISSYGQSNISIEGFRVVAPAGDGVAVGGAPGRPAGNVRAIG
jgi:hypothetical protein